jgi:hypothetical protein
MMEGDTSIEETSREWFSVVSNLCRLADGGCLSLSRLVLIPNSIVIFSL